MAGWALVVVVTGARQHRHLHRALFALEQLAGVPVARDAPPQALSTSSGDKPDIDVRFLGFSALFAALFLFVYLAVYLLGAKGERV